MAMAFTILLMTNGDHMAITVNKFLQDWKEAQKNEDKRRSLAEDIWYDWFCSGSALYNRTKKFIRPLTIMVRRNPKVGELELSGKNCCPIKGSLYDVLRLFDPGEDGKFRAYISFDGRQEMPVQAAIEDQSEAIFMTSKDAARFVADNLK